RDFSSDSRLAAGIQPASRAGNEFGGTDTSDGTAGGDRVRKIGLCFVANRLAADSGSVPRRNCRWESCKTDPCCANEADFCFLDVFAGNLAGFRSEERRVGKD